MHMPRAFTVAAVIVLSTALAPWARADPLFGWGQNALEDAYDERDFDEEDLVGARMGAFTTPLDLHGGSWVSLVGLAKWLRSGKRDYGGMVVVGLAFDRIAAGSHRALADPARLPIPAQLPADSVASKSEPSPVPPSWREAAWRQRCVRPDSAWTTRDSTRWFRAPARVRTSPRRAFVRCVCGATPIT